MFKVEWLEEALDELMTLWMRADFSDRLTITTASQTVDQRLGSNPFNEGESREDGLRITFVPPLAIDFQIEPDGQTVTILHARWFGPRKK